MVWGFGVVRLLHESHIYMAGRDAYPFMNPTTDLVYDAKDMWHMLELTR